MLALLLIHISTLFPNHNVKQRQNRRRSRKIKINKLRIKCGGNFTENVDEFHVRVVDVSGHQRAPGSPFLCACIEVEVIKSWQKT